MPTNLTSVKIKDSFSQLLHVNNGPEATAKTVYSATGTATALRVGTANVEVDNIRFDGNVISTTNTDGSLELTPNGSGSVVIAKVEFTDVPQARTALGLGTAAMSAAADFATAAQGDKADTAVQPGDIGTLAAQDADSVNITGGAISNVVFSGSFSGMTLVQATNMLATGGVGYATGASAGGSVTQLTDKTTGVTLNRPTGRITMAAGSIANDARVSFTLTNSYIAATDIIVANISSGATADTYDLTTTAVAAGSCRIQVHNLSNAGIDEQLVINFAVIKGAIT